MPTDDDLSRPLVQNDHDNELQRNDSQSSDDELHEELTGCGATVCCDPSSKCHRFLALILMCLVGFGM